MHVVLAILGFVAGAIFLVWRVYIAVQAAREAAHLAQDAARTVRNLPRRMQFLRKSHKGALDTVKDPVEAAVILMVAVARAGGGPSLAHAARMKALLAARFAVSEAECEPFIQQMEWLTKDLTADAAMARFGPMVTAGVSKSEASELASMLAEIVAADNLRTEAQTALIGKFRALAQLD